MARHFDHRTVFVSPGKPMPGKFDSRRTAPYQPPMADEEASPVRVMLIAIRHDPEPPVFAGPHLLQRLQALLAAPNEWMRQASLGLHSGSAEPVPADEMQVAQALSPARLLPPMSAPPPDDPQVRQPRLVRGDILSDSAGQLYERFGQQVRPLNRVVSGPRGEILELVPRSPSAPPHNRRESDIGVVVAEPIADNRLDVTKTPASSAQGAKGMNHSTAANGGAAFVRQPITPPHRPRPDMRRRLTVQYTKPAQPPQASLVPPVQQRQEPVKSSPTPPIQTESEAPKPAEAANANPVTGQLKIAIPEQWIKPWEFRISREEALYDLQHVAARPTIFNTICNLKRRFGTNEALRKWQSLLASRSPEEQLWDVRPPAGRFAHPQVRNWAQQTLALAGYDSHAMLPEWEIFWRRKGV